MGLKFKGIKFFLCVFASVCLENLLNLVKAHNFLSVLLVAKLYPQLFYSLFLSTP